ncbi:MAG: ATP-binding cassette domain-containing protein, partial [Cyanobium sp.]
MAAAILDVEHLTVCRDGATVVEDVSFSLPPESDTALVGPNGAGKSSLVQALLGILPRRSGTIRLLGHGLGPRGQLPVAVRDSIAYLPQTLSLRG